MSLLDLISGAIGSFLSGIAEIFIVVISFFNFIFIIAVELATDYTFYLMLYEAFIMVIAVVSSKNLVEIISNLVKYQLYLIKFIIYLSSYLLKIPVSIVRLITPTK